MATVLTKPITAYTRATSIYMLRLNNKADATIILTTLDEIRLTAINLSQAVGPTITLYKVNKAVTAKIEITTVIRFT